MSAMSGFLGRLNWRAISLGWLALLLGTIAVVIFTAVFPGFDRLLSGGFGGLITHIIAGVVTYENTNKAKWLNVLAGIVMFYVIIIAVSLIFVGFSILSRPLEQSSRLYPTPPNAAVEFQQTPSTTETPETQAPNNSVASHEVLSLVEKYLKLGESQDVELAINLYADTILYYDKGMVSKEFLREDKVAYASRWPKRIYTRVTDISVISSNYNTQDITFDYSFTVENGNRRLSGKANVTLQLEKRDGKVLISQESGSVYQNP